MTAAGLKKSHKKRKQVDDDITESSPFAGAVGLEMLSDEEGEEGAPGSDDGEVDEFPEIDSRSDSEDEGYDGSDVEGSSDENEEEAHSASDTDSDFHIFPQSKTIISDITGHPKRVYPEIEPDYDSDSSTEDVRHRGSCYLFRNA
jgi:ribosome biogenesis protein ERB1